MRGPGRRALFLEFPLLKRELIGLLRTRRALWLLVLTVAVSSLLPLLGWPSRESGPYSGMDNATVVVVFLLAQLAVALVSLPAFTAGAISGERERDTYPLLYSTLISPFSIVFSKALASAGYIVILLLASAPSVCVLYLLGGIDFRTLLLSYAVTFAAVGASALACLGQSMRSRRTAHAAVRGVVWVVLWNGGLALIILLVMFFVDALWGGLDVERSSFHLVCLSPFTVIPFLVFPQPITGAGGLPDPYFYYAGGLSLAYLLYLVWHVRTPEVSGSRRRERRLARREGRRAGRGIPRSLLTHVLLRLGKSELPLFSNPIFLKEIRSEFFARIWYRRLAFWAPLAIFIGILVVVHHHRGSANILATVIGLVAAALLALLVPGVAAGAFPREIEQGNLDFIRGSLLSQGEVLQGKFLAAIYSCAGILAAVAWALLAALFFLPIKGDSLPFREDPLRIAFVLASVLLMTLLFTAAVGTLASVVSRRALGALVISYLAVLGGFVLWPVVLELGGVHGSFPYSVTNPFPALAMGIENPGESNLALFLILYAGAVVALWAASLRLLRALRERDR